MKKRIFLFLSLLLPLVVFAKEPTNLAVVKKDLIRYHDSGAYAADINSVIQDAGHYLNTRLSQKPADGKKPAIVLDIDETSLSNYRNIVAMDFGGTPQQIRQSEDDGKDTVITPTLNLYRFAKAHNIAVFFITGRYVEERDVTIKNLESAGYSDWNGLYFREGIFKHTSAAVYKTALRKKLENQGYDIILSVGDQKSDLAGGYADKTFKLPNPYYFIP